MMHYRSHRGRWWYNPMGQPKRPTLMERLIGAMREIFQHYKPPEGRRRIDSTEPYGAWANGWSSPVMPKEKAR